MLIRDNIRLSAVEIEDLKFVHQLNNNSSIMSYWFEEPYLKKAKAIVAYRGKEGKFRTVNDLSAVPGVACKTLVFGQ